MIIGLGNTLDDVASDINAGDFNSIVPDIGSGLQANDGWAILLTVTGLYVAFRILQGTYRAPKKVGKAVSSKVRKSRRKLARVVEGK